jgi:type IV pilus assembly protein PilB
MLPIRRIVKKHLGELLIERGVITQAQLEKGLALQKEKGGLIGQILVSLGYTSEEEIAQVLTVQYGFPYLPLQNYELNRSVVKLVPENIAKQYCVIPIDKIGDTVTVAMSNPLNLQAVEELEMITKSKVQLFVSTMTDITTAIGKFYREEQKE